MITTAIGRTWQQLLHPSFRSVFLLSVSAALFTLILLVAALNHLWPETFVTGYDWLDQFGTGLAQAGFWTVAIFGSYLLFPGIVTMVMGLLIDRVTAAVEDEYYPNRLGTRKIPYGDVVISALKLTLIMIVVNLLALLPYILLFFMTGGLGTLALFILINGFLMGREYFEMVALRHMNHHDVTRMRKQYGNRIFIGGAVVAGMFLVPLLNLLAPIAGAAIMTHIFHHLWAAEPTHNRRHE